MARTSTFDLHDGHMSGRLTHLLVLWRSEGRTYEQITDLLREQHGIDVATSTVYRWCRRLPAPVEKAS